MTQTPIKKENDNEFYSLVDTDQNDILAQHKHTQALLVLRIQWLHNPVFLMFQHRLYTNLFHELHF
jgi:hypothetical protein